MVIESLAKIIKLLYYSLKDKEIRCNDDGICSGISNICGNIILVFQA